MTIRKSSNLRIWFICKPIKEGIELQTYFFPEVVHAHRADDKRVQNENEVSLPASSVSQPCSFLSQKEAAVTYSSSVLPEINTHSLRKEHLQTWALTYPQIHIHVITCVQVCVHACVPIVHSSCMSHRLKHGRYSLLLSLSVIWRYSLSVHIKVPHSFLQTT